MYSISEPKLEKLIDVAQSVSEKLAFSGTITSQDVRVFGSAILEVQTEVRNQLPKDQL